jgi:hypothetical protein
MAMRIMPSNVVGPSVRAPSCDPDCRRASVLQRYLYVLITIAISPAIRRRATRMDGEDDRMVHWTCFQIARERIRLIWTRCRP